MRLSLQYLSHTSDRTLDRIHSSEVNFLHRVQYSSLYANNLKFCSCIRQAVNCKVVANLHLKFSNNFMMWERCSVI